VENQRGWQRRPRWRGGGSWCRCASVYSCPCLLCGVQGLCLDFM
jgi:hypothetical protein